MRPVSIGYSETYTEFEVIKEIWNLKIFETYLKCLPMGQLPQEWCMMHTRISPYSNDGVFESLPLRCIEKEEMHLITSQQGQQAYLLYKFNYATSQAISYATAAWFI